MSTETISSNEVAPITVSASANEKGKPLFMAIVFAVVALGADSWFPFRILAIFGTIEYFRQYWHMCGKYNFDENGVTHVRFGLRTMLRYDEVQFVKLAERGMLLVGARGEIFLPDKRESIRVGSFLPTDLLREKVPAMAAMRIQPPIAGKCAGIAAGPFLLLFATIAGCILWSIHRELAWTAILLFAIPGIWILLTHPHRMIFESNRIVLQRLFVETVIRKEQMRRLEYAWTGTLSLRLVSGRLINLAGLNLSDSVLRDFFERVYGVQP